MIFRIYSHFRKHGPCNKIFFHIKKTVCHAAKTVLNSVSCQRYSTGNHAKTPTLSSLHEMTMRHHVHSTPSMIIRWYLKLFQFSQHFFKIQYVYIFNKMELYLVLFLKHLHIFNAYLRICFIRQSSNFSCHLPHLLASLRIAVIVKKVTDLN